MIPQIPKQKIPLRGFDDDNIKPAERLHLWRMYFDKVSRGQGLGFLVRIIITAIKYHDRKQLGQESGFFSLTLPYNSSLFKRSGGRNSNRVRTQR